MIPRQTGRIKVTGVLFSILTGMSLATYSSTYDFLLSLQMNCTISSTVAWRMTSLSTRSQTLLPGDGELLSSQQALLSISMPASSVNA